MRRLHLTIWTLIVACLVFAAFDPSVRPSGRVLVEAVGVAAILGVITGLVVRRFSSLDQRLRFLTTLNPNFEKRWVKHDRRTPPHSSEQDDAEA